jgi:predicted enzyme related to lactoylglutathione lyase
MSSRWWAVTVDCADAWRVARFWGEVLGWTIADEASGDEHVVLVPAEGGPGGPRLVFNVVPEPKTVKDRIHLDVVSDDFDAEREHLELIGARTLADHRSGGSRWTTMTDVEGNEFDLIDGAG